MELIIIYDSIISKRRDYVLLDVLEEKDLYPKMEDYPVKVSFVVMKKTVKIHMPVIDCLLGDKLTAGISKISSHLVNTRFRLEDAKISASRAVLLAALLKSQPKGRAFKDFRWDPKRVSELPSLMLKPPLENLNRIKTLIPEAFYNLYTAQDLLI